MSHVTDAMRRHHADLLSRLSEQVQRLAEDPVAADPAALAHLLNDDLLPHAAGEERHLYPAVDPLIKAHGSATATMSIDHEVITDYVRQIDDLARAVAAADPRQRPAMVRRMAQLGLQLEAIVRLHLRKEEDVYLPLFERYVSTEDQQRVLDGMHEAQPGAR
jgi:hemerythrin-like domain-containing protein